MDSTLTISPTGPSDRWLLKWGAFILWSAFGFILLLLLYLTWAAYWILPFVPIVLLAPAAAFYLFKRPLLNLAVVLSGFSLIVGFKAGLQAEEILYGLYYLSFLGYWFFTRSYLQRQVICNRPEERTLLIFLVLVTLTVPLSVAFDGWPDMIFGEWLSFTMLGFYWPIKEAIEKDERGLKVVVGSLIVVGLFVLVRNLLEYQSDLSNAEQLWQIASSRAITNESLLMIPAFFCIVLYLRTRSFPGRMLLLATVLGMFAGLILTQSRAYWVTFFLGTGFIFMFVSGKDKIRILSVGIVSAVGIGTLAYVILGDYLMLVLSGLLDRFLTLQSAVSNDVSLINRFLETQGVWEHIKVNPILGYGMGVPYRFYNITFEYSEIKTFVHNGYVALLFKFGVWGLGMMLFMMVRFFVTAFQNWKKRHDQLLPRLISLSVAAGLLALSVNATTANPFYQNDLMFIYASLWGIAGGIRARRTAIQQRVSG